MNAVEIEEAISALAEAPFGLEEFPYAFLEAFGNKATTIKRLRSGASNKSDIGGVLQTSNIHIKTCAPGQVSQTLAALRESPATKRGKAKFILATDGQALEAEDLVSDIAPIVCEYPDFPDHFGFFLPLAGISTVMQIRESAFDIKATGRLNRLYVELLKDNPEWGTAERRHDMNHFMARLIFCFFAEDTDIFAKPDLFTSRVETMSAPDSSNTHEVISELFRAMNIPSEKRANADIARWAQIFPYVNGGLFSGSADIPHFSKIARSYLLHIGNLDWTKINPDIFGSMIQAVADDEERGALGMHYTSVPNILKVLNPLFLDDLREKLGEAGDNPRKLANLRKRMSKIRVFDPACGSGNFLVIAYKEMRGIEARLNARCGTADRRSEIPLTNFRGIELADFSAEIARLALIIAEYQCDVTHRGHKDALAALLPLDTKNWITQGNALRLDWLSVCPPTAQKVELRGEDLFMSPLDKAQIDFRNEGGETYICGNPPYLGSQWQNKEQKEDLKAIFDGRVKNWKTLDYVAGWFMKAADFGRHTDCTAAFVSTNSICQGRQVSVLWPAIFFAGHHISFAHTSFKWANLASHNAGVTVAIIAISNMPNRTRRLYSLNAEGEAVMKEVENINAYLVAAPNVAVEASSKPISQLPTMTFGNQPIDGGHLVVSAEEKRQIVAEGSDFEKYIYRYLGSREYINGIERWCLWINPSDETEAAKNPKILEKVEAVRQFRLGSPRKETVEQANNPFQFVYRPHKDCDVTLIVPSASSERRPVLPCGIVPAGTTVSNLAFALYDAPLWNMALIASRLHLVWIATVCGKLETRYRYSNTLGWNTFPVPKLTGKNRADLTRCAEDILLAREAHFPATIADLYKPDAMPENLRAAHDRNDEVLERIYIGRRFRNDTERLEKLFELYTRMARKGAA